ncbi:MAG TPA: phosphatase PAP2 family protein [Gemmatimonadaceae bacterium]|nr:phosphatase PAP2 family protein [Gemmatimonadaceae bacterium]
MGVRNRISIAAVATLGLFGSNVGAQTQDTITTSKKPLFVWGDAVTAGAFALATVALAPVDRQLTASLQQPPRQTNRILHNGATIFRLFGQPGSLIVAAGMYGLGTADGQRRTQDLGLHTLMAIALSSGETGVIKIVAGRARPRKDPDNARDFGLFRGLRDDDYRSFPSGHTTSAFAFASTVASETQRWWPGTRWVIGPIVYGGAALTGLSRIYNNEHWASDVMAGAALGTLTGIKIVRYQHSHPNNYLDRKLLRAGVNISNDGRWMPTISTVSF